MNDFQKWLAKCPLKQKEVAARLGVSAPYITNLKKINELRINEKNELVRETVILKLWSVKDENK